MVGCAGDPDKSDSVLAGVFCGIEVGVEKERRVEVLGGDERETNCNVEGLVIVGVDVANKVENTIDDDSTASDIVDAMLD
jgi:hypothetical protein